MGKSIYSLALSDEIMALIDGIAYKKGVSRSTMVNGILADFVGYETPEKQHESIISFIDNLVMGQSRMRLEPLRSDNGFSIVSALNYKYSPRITYTVSPAGGGMGELSVVYRTSKPELLSAISDFFASFIDIEKKHRGGGKYFVRDGKLKRTLDYSGSSGEELATEIMNYVATLDKLLNAYIADDRSVRDELLEERYLMEMISKL